MVIAAFVFEPVNHVYKQSQFKVEKKHTDFSTLNSAPRYEDLNRVGRLAPCPGRLIPDKVTRPVFIEWEVCWAPKIVCFLRRTGRFLAIRNRTHISRSCPGHKTGPYTN